MGSQRPRPVKASVPPLRTVAKTAWLSGFLTLASAALAPRTPPCEFGFACCEASAPLTPVVGACAAAVPVTAGRVDAIAGTLACGTLVSLPTEVAGVVQAD